MSKERYVNTIFWDDDYIDELPALEKLLYVFFITNKYTNIAGIYKIPFNKIYKSTGLTKEQAKQFLSKFEEDGKVCYVDEYLILKNSIRHQKTTLYKIRKGICNIIETIPEHIKTIAKDRLSIDYDSLYIEFNRQEQTSNYLNSNSNSNSNSNKNQEQKKSADAASAASSPSPAAGPGKKTEKKKDFIDELIEIWCEEYKEDRGIDYVVHEKDRAATGIILKNFKKDNTKLTSQETAESLRLYFRKAIKIRGEPFFENITLTRLNGQVNEYNQLIAKNEKKNNSSTKAVNEI